jgi:O-antigen ligase
VITLHFLKRDIMGFRWYQSLILTALLSVFIFFLAAKTELLLLGLLVTYFLFRSLKKGSSKLMPFLIAPLLLAGFIWAFTRNARVQEKLNEIKKRQTEGMVNWKDMDPRTRSWFYSFQLIRENPILGTGLNARNILAEEYRKGGYTVDAELRLNAHNQYLETQMTLGLPGTLILLWMLFNPLIFRRQTWKPVLIIPFMLIICVSMITESILVRQWGIMFYVMFYCLLLLPEEADSE